MMTQNKDAQIYEEMRKLYEANENTTPIEFFQHALKQGASVEMLRSLALDCVGDENGHSMEDFPRYTRLLYVPLMLEAGYRKEEVMAFVIDMCLKRPEGAGDNQLSPSNHREAFWMDATAWDLFETNGMLYPFVNTLARNEPFKALRYWRVMAFEFGRRFQPKLTDLENIIHAGARSATEIALVASKDVPAVSRPEMETLELLPLSAQGNAARTMLCNSIGLMYKAQMLSRPCGDGRDGEGILSSIRAEINRHPYRAAAIYRWCMEGVRLAKGEAWWMDIWDEELRRTIESNGWRFLRLVQWPRKNQSGFDLQAIYEHDGRKEVFVHKMGGRGEVLTAGDEVIVPVRQDFLKDPTYRKGGLSIYHGELQATAPPTETMLRDARAYLSIDSAKRAF